MELYKIACVCLPFVGAFQRYCVAYGFEGLSKQSAYRSALHVFLTLTLASMTYALIFWKGN